eukprot:scaffold95643_cov58-Phaeocystis_antarctica.AAC.12
MEVLPLLITRYSLLATHYLLLTGDGGPHGSPNPNPTPNPNPNPDPNPNPNQAMEVLMAADAAVSLGISRTMIVKIKREIIPPPILTIEGGTSGE